MEFVDICQEGTCYYQDVFALYEKAFPECEKKPEKMLLDGVRKGTMELLAIVENGQFVGLAMNLKSGNTALLDYFAIAEEKRGGGVGSRAIRMLQERFAGKKYILEIERPVEEMTGQGRAAAEKAGLSEAEKLQRTKRKRFYLRNGLKETGVYVYFYENYFELLTFDGKLTYEEYRDFLGKVLDSRLLGPDKLHPLEK